MILHRSSLECGLFLLIRAASCKRLAADSTFVIIRGIFRLSVSSDCRVSVALIVSLPTYEIHVIFMVSELSDACAGSHKEPLA